MPIPQALVRDSLRIHLEVPGVTSVFDEEGGETENVIGLAISKIVVRQ
jgi:hypothetical protein